MLRRLLFLALTAALAVGVIIAPAAAQGRGDGPVIYVESQDLYYDSIITADPLPAEGPFQQLYMTDKGLTTMYGPGDTGYVGGRWWVDVNGNDEMDEEDHFFSCPLLGPGRAEA